MDRFASLDRDRWVVAELTLIGGKRPSMIVKEGSVWNIVARLASNRQLPRYFLEPQCDVLADNINTSLLTVNLETYNGAVHIWKDMEHFSKMPLEDLALHVNEERAWIKNVMTVRLNCRECGCECDLETCPFKE